MAHEDQDIARFPDGGPDVRSRESLAVGLASDVGGEDDRGTVAAGREPLAEHRLGLAAGVPGRERREWAGSNVSKNMSSCTRSELRPRAMPRNQYDAIDRHRVSS